jgi:hypothetical protein
MAELHPFCLLTHSLVNKRHLKKQEFGLSYQRENGSRAGISLALLRARPNRVVLSLASKHSLQREVEIEVGPLQAVSGSDNPISELLRFTCSVQRRIPRRGTSRTRRRRFEQA